MGGYRAGNILRRSHYNICV